VIVFFFIILYFDLEELKAELLATKELASTAGNLQAQRSSEESTQLEKELTRLQNKIEESGKENQNLLAEIEISKRQNGKLTFFFVHSKV
jgi:septal ring factor EnvC (AmiA/AmiB activator)